MNGYKRNLTFRQYSVLTKDNRNTYNLQNSLNVRTYSSLTKEQKNKLADGPDLEEFINKSQPENIKRKKGERFSLLSSSQILCNMLHRHLFHSKNICPLLFLTSR